MTPRICIVLHCNISRTLVEKTDDLKYSLYSVLCELLYAITKYVKLTDMKGGATKDSENSIAIRTEKGTKFSREIARYSTEIRALQWILNISYGVDVDLNSLFQLSSKIQQWKVAQLTAGRHCLFKENLSESSSLFVS